jgi:hypothetical protein
MLAVRGEHHVYPGGKKKVFSRNIQMSSNQTAMTTSLQVLEKGKAFHYKKI